MARFEKPRPFQYVRFDFVDTLAMQPFFLNPPAGVVSWSESILTIYEQDNLIKRWSLDELSFGDVDGARFAEDLLSLRSRLA